MKRSYSYQYTKVANEAKRANTRLRAIEKANLTRTSAYENVRRMGFDDSKHIAYTKNGEIKFRTDVSKMSESELKEHQRVIEYFLQSKSSKVGEIKKRRQQAYDKWKKEKERQGQNIDMDVNEFSEFWELSIIKKLKDAYGSEEVEYMVLTYGESTVIETIQEMEKEGLNPYNMSIQEIHNRMENFNKHKKKEEQNTLNLKMLQMREALKSHKST